MSLKMEPLPTPVEAAETIQVAQAIQTTPDATPAPVAMASAQDTAAQTASVDVEPAPALEPAPQSPAHASPQVARQLFEAGRRPEPRRSRRKPILLGALGIGVCAAGAALLTIGLPGLPSSSSNLIGTELAGNTATADAAPSVVPPAAPEGGDEAAARLPAAATPAPSQPAPASTAREAPPVAANNRLSLRGKRDQPVFIASPATATALDSAYAALTAGRFDEAAEHYRRALAGNGGEIDALLGLAYIARREGRNPEARDYYGEILRTAPSHPDATAGLLALAADGDILAAASRAADNAQRNPGSANAQAALGDLRARQGRFADAQQAFFRAFSLEPGNPLHAYNLAVALDRLHKYPQALDYYRRSIALSERLPVEAFPSRSLALQRAGQLEQGAAPSPSAGDGARQGRESP
ncbi:hypothetical protein B9N43_16885 [Denitratisoma sp. DHT3]|uniref:tetratricopeptide repeat protein n=1 Tax=Denitratisoma sp. DHT3 TaxID=1981880 RepID=UPI0011985B33|nr:tetratricopeptide repeat protein [Denitratisoma sp. DHT3]QDX82761.1 hypothetical protein B9N43_16885 [Denitratisoma sp. DHT3]